MPTPSKSNPTPNGPAKKVAPRRARKESPKTGTAQGIAAKRAQVRGEDGTSVDPYAPTVWGSDNAQGSLIDLELPSGQLVMAQRPGPEGLMAAGLLDDMDMLAGKLPKQGKPLALKDIDTSQIQRDPKKLAQAMKLVDRVVVHVVIKPELTPEPDNPAHREMGKIYPSTVGIEDKMFIFNWAVGGTRDLAKFRQQFSGHVAAVDDGADVEDPAE